MVTHQFNCIGSFCRILLESSFKHNTFKYNHNWNNDYEDRPENSNRKYVDYRIFLGVLTFKTYQIKNILIIGTKKTIKR